MESIPKICAQGGKCIVVGGPVIRDDQEHYTVVASWMEGSPGAQTTYWHRQCAGLDEWGQAAQDSLTLLRELNDAEDDV